MSNKNEDKKICKINDSRISYYTKSIRCGSEQIFYTGNDHRDFDLYNFEGGARNRGIVMHDKPDTIRLKPPQRHYYANIINGEWWWINGCPECNGREPEFAYMKCVEHDVCLICSIQRVELKEIPWGHRLGFICKPCHDAKHEAEKREALELFAKKDYDSMSSYTTMMSFAHIAHIHTHLTICTKTQKLSAKDVMENTMLSLNILLHTAQP